MPLRRIDRWRQRHRASTLLYLMASRCTYALSVSNNELMEL